MHDGCKKKETEEYKKYKKISSSSFFEFTRSCKIITIYKPLHPICGSSGNLSFERL